MTPGHGKHTGHLALYEWLQKNVKAAEVEHFGPKSFVSLSGSYHYRGSAFQLGSYAKDIFPTPVG
jgi:hypothetical protein